MNRTPNKLSIGLLWLFAAVSINFSAIADVLEDTSTKPVPLEPINVPYPWFATSEISGYAEVLFEVDEKGDPSDFIVLKSTHRAFSLAVIVTIKETRFKPATLEGKPTKARVIYQNHFIPDRQVGVRKIGDESRPYRVDENSLDSLVVGQRDLDQPLQRIEATPPIYPPEFKDTNQSGGVLIEFFIDEKGIVRAPIVISSSHKALGKSALEAIRQWKFSPPQRRGEPVTVRAFQQINF